MIYCIQSGKLGVTLLQQILICTLPAAVFVILGCIWSRSHKTAFLGLICWCLAGLCLCTGLLAFLHGCNPSAAKIITWILAGILAVGLIMATVMGVLVAKAATGAKARACDCVVVLGAKVDDAEPSGILQERIDAACAYLTDHPETVAVLSGGQGSDEAISEAQCIYNCLTARGIAPGRLWIEDRSTSTWENLHFSLQLIAEKTGTRPASLGIITSEFHLYRANIFAGKCGVEMVGIPAKTKNKLHYVNYYLREIAGVWHYYLLGGLYHD